LYNRSSSEWMSAEGQPVERDRTTDVARQHDTCRSQGDKKKGKKSGGLNPLHGENTRWVACRPRMEKSHSHQPRTGRFPIFSIAWYSLFPGRWDSKWWKKYNRNPEWWADFSQLQIQIKQKSQFEFVPRNTLECKSNQNLNSTLYSEIPRNLIFSILTSWLKSPHHSVFRLPFNSASRVSSSTERGVENKSLLFCFWFLEVIEVNSGINKVHRD
jgi:hypothetical protein